MRAFLFIAVIASLFYALDQSIKTQRQQHFAQIKAEIEEAQARATRIYLANKKADEEKEMAQAMAESEAAQRATASRQELEASFAKLAQEEQEARDKWEQEERKRRDLVTLRELTTPVSQPAYNPYANPMSPENMAAQGLNPRFWSTPQQSSGATIITGSGGVYTTHGGAAGGATIIHQGAGHYEVRQRDGTMRRVIVTP